MKEKDIALLAYLTHFGLLAAFFLNRKEKSSFARFHIKNMFGICLIHFIGSMLGRLDFEILHSTIFTISIFMWIISFVRMLLKHKAGVPFLDKVFQKSFKFLD